MHDGCSYWLRLAAKIMKESSSDHFFNHPMAIPMTKLEYFLILAARGSSHAIRISS